MLSKVKYLNEKTGAELPLDKRRRGAGCADLVPHAGGAVPSGDEPRGVGVRLKGDDHGVLVRSATRREAGGAHDIVAQHTHNQVVGRAIELPLPVEGPEQHLTRGVDPDARRGTSRSAGKGGRLEWGHGSCRDGRTRGDRRDGGSSGVGERS
ncbi:hypothetical protein B0H14DRAFT_1534967, partial [Mycena olivaceomarginata]